MSLKLYSHPLASYCWKVLMAFYENGTPFEPVMVNLSDAAGSAAFRRLWPMAKMPVLHDAERDRALPESTIIIEYLTIHHAGAAEFLPADPDTRLEARLQDRFFDIYVHEPMQRIVLDRLRGPAEKDPTSVAAAHQTIAAALDMIEERMADREWAVGEALTIADCAAAPALFYANEVHPFAGTHPNTARYLDRLKARPSFARVLEEAEPFFQYFPRE